MSKYILPKLITYSTINFINIYNKILNDNNSDDFVVIGVYDCNNPEKAITYNGNDVKYYEFFIDIKSINLYKDCIELNKFININKNKKFIIISDDGFYLAQSVARYISEFWLTKKQREIFMLLNFDIFADNFELSFWLRRSYFNLKITDNEIFLIQAMNKYLISLKEPSLKNIS